MNFFRVVSRVSPVVALLSMFVGEQVLQDWNGVELKRVVQYQSSKAMLALLAK